MKHFLPLFLFSLFLIGCATPQEPKKVELPTWMVKPVKDTKEIYYGVGAGKSAEDAVVQALSSISAHLYVRIENSMKQPESFIRFIGDETTKKNVLSFIKSELKSLDYTHFKVVDSLFVDQEFVVLLSMKRALLFTQEEKEFNTQISKLETEVLARKEHSSFEYFVELHRTQKQREFLLSQISILHTLNSAFVSKRYQTFINQIDEQYSTSKEKLQMQLISDAKAIYFVEPIKNALDAEGIKVNKSLTNRQDIVTVLLSATTQQDEKRKKKVIKTRLNITTKETQKELSSTTHTLHGESYGSYTEARSETSDHLKNKIDSLGIFTVLGF